MNKKLFFITIAAVFTFAGCQSSKAAPELSPQQLIKDGQIEAARSKFMLTTDINGIDSDGNTVLHLAAQINDPDLITFFLIKGADSELKNFQGDTPLHIAIKNNSYEAAKVLAATGGNLFARDAKGNTALDLGLNRDAFYYDLFITTKAGEIRDSDGQTIVHYFVKTKNLKGIQKCIAKGLPISVKDYQHKTPLDLAFNAINDEESVEIAAELILGGADEIETDFAYFQDAVAARNLNNRFDDGQTPLHLSAMYGHNAIATYLLDNEADTRVQDSSGATPLHEAIRYGNLEIARMLLDAGANINAKDNLGKTPILLIVPQSRAYETYDLLIRYHADLKEKDMYGDTVLHTAAMLGVSTNVMRMLAVNGADINARNKEGVTPLEITIQQNNVSTTKMFTLLGANIHTKNTHGDSPLTLALAADNDILEATVVASNSMVQDSEGNTPLLIAILNDSPLTKIQYIISLSDDVNIRNRDGNSALFISALKNWKEVGELLLAKNADIFATNTDNNSPLRLALKNGGDLQNWLITSKTIKSTDGSGNTVLHYAAEWQFVNSIQALSTKGADINAKNANGETPLFSAAKTNNPEIIQTVIKCGASIRERDNLGNTPLHTAVKWDADRSANVLISLGININAQNSAGKSPLDEAAFAGKYKVAHYLLTQGADANACDTNGVSVLVDTIKTQNTDMVKLLLKYGANPNLQEINGQNAYHAAAYTGNREIISLIRKAGGNPLSRDKQGNTPFSLVLKRDIRIIKEVLGDSYNITDSDGNSPIHITIKNGASPELLQRLISEGYPIDTRNADGYTPLNYAIEANDLNNALILLENGANPFQTIDKKGTNGVTIALANENKQMISNIVKYAGAMTDIQGNTILHYAAKTSSIEIVKTLLSFGIDVNVKNVSGETPYTIATRWKRPEIARLFQNSKEGK
ncbi:MAG: ankyrin repeat domain-containing protein [Treponema sp.]|nr:ankyrin repeat domain-containing protein [Treponema sp.]